MERSNAILSGGRAGRARLMRNMLDAKAPPTETEIKKAPPYEEADSYAATQVNRAFCVLAERQ